MNNPPSTGCAAGSRCLQLAQGNHGRSANSCSRLDLPLPRGSLRLCSSGSFSMRNLAAHGAIYPRHPGQKKGMRLNNLTARIQTRNAMDPARNKHARQKRNLSCPPSAVSGAQLEGPLHKPPESIKIQRPKQKNARVSQDGFPSQLHE